MGKLFIGRKIKKEEIPKYWSTLTKNLTSVCGLEKVYIVLYIPFPIYSIEIRYKIIKGKGKINLLLISDETNIIELPPSKKLLTYNVSNVIPETKIIKLEYIPFIKKVTYDNFGIPTDEFIVRIKHIKVEHD